MKPTSDEPLSIVMEIKTIGVIGAGTMGRGIAYAAAFGGYRTILEDVSPAMLDQGLAYIKEALEEGVSRGKVAPAQKDKAIANLQTSQRVEDVCREADLLIGARRSGVEAGNLHDFRQVREAQRNFRQQHLVAV